MFHVPRPSFAQRARRGVSSVEMIVAFVLLSTLLSVSTALIVKHGRIVQAQRQYRIALDELSNQIETLSTLPEAELEAAIQNLKPTEFAGRRLPGAKIEADLDAGEPSRRLTLRLAWDEPQRDKAPVTLVAWITPSSAASAASSSAGDQP
jgi:hypothetical protein